MRIISGAAKGRKLFTPPSKDLSIRPTSDRSRESLFNIIGTTTHHANILDLFAGTGAFGLEALSRGAAHVTFVDHAKSALLLVKKNLELIVESIKSHNSTKTYSTSIHKQDLSRKDILSKTNLFDVSEFDVIFLDPPYAKGLSTKLLVELDQCSTLKDNVLIIVEEKSNQLAPDNLSTLSMKDKRKYGDTVFWFFNKISE